MKKFSQYINSNEDCNCDQSVDEGILSNIGTFATGAAKTVSRALANGAAKVIGGEGASDIVKGGTAAVENRNKDIKQLKLDVIKCARELEYLQQDFNVATATRKKAIQVQITRKKLECAQLSKLKPGSAAKQTEKDIKTSYDALMNKSPRPWDTP
jgi:hypothetical protein